MAAPPTLKSVLSLLRKDAGLGSDAERLGQLAWMVVLKALDEREQEQEIVDDRFQSPLPERLRFRSFAGEALPEGAALLAFVNDELFPGLASLPVTRDPTTTLVREVFGRATNRMTSAPLLRQALDALRDVDLNHLAARRAFQAELEALIGGSTAADGGVHHAPPALARFLIERLDPELGEAILDPSCGSGAFLIAAAARLRDRWVRLPEHEAVLERSLFGATPQPFSWLLATTRLLLQGLVLPEHVRCADVLARPLRHLGDRYDVVVGIPPLGGKAAPEVVEGFPLPLRTTDLGALHLQHAMHVLRFEGRGALVLPDGALFAEGARARVREKLLEECDVHTIVRLPGGVFAPQTNLRMNLIFFTRGRPTKEIWYYEQQPPLGLKGYTRKRPLEPEDFDGLRAFWERREESDTAFRLSIDTVKAHDFNLDLRNPRARVTSVEIAGPPSPPRAALAGQGALTVAGRAVAVDPRGAVRVRGVTLRDFRGFARLELELPAEGSAVLIGVNGAGKSTVLDAVAAVLSPLATLTAGIAMRYAESHMTLEDIRAGEDLGRVGVTLGIEGALQHLEVRANRAKGIIGSELGAYARVLGERLIADASTNLPVLCFYSANRSLGEESPGRRLTYLHRQQRAYDRAFRRGLGPFHDFLDWFREEEDVENEVRLRRDPTYRHPRLEVVRSAVQRFLGELGAGSFTDLRIERFGEERPAPKGARKQGELLLKKEGTELRIEQLSEGEKNTILLVSDLARRLTEANPGRDEPLTGHGVVLIDELDVHLHPGWQRAFLPALEATFPGCQLIVSTHSPQVLSRVHKEHVFIFENFQRLEVTPYTYGRDSNSILSEVMGLPEHPLDVTEKIREVAVLLDDGQYEEGKAALQALGELLGEHDVEVVRLKTVLTFLES